MNTQNTNSIQPTEDEKAYLVTAEAIHRLITQDEISLGYGLSAIAKLAHVYKQGKTT